MQKETAILFKISAGQGTGIGHLTRSLALADEFKKTEVSNIRVFCDYFGDEKVFDNIKEDYNLRFFTGEGKSTEELLKEIEKDRIKALLIDQPQENIELCRAVKEMSPDTLISALDYFNYHNHYLDAIINLFNQNADILSPGDIFPGRYFQGLKYAIIREEFIADRRVKKDIEERARRVLITFGGADVWQNTLKAVEFLTDVDYPLEIKIVIGPEFGKGLVTKITNKIEQLNRHHGELLQGVTSLRNLIRWADIGFSSPGSTLMEFLFSGTPALVMPGDIKESRFIGLFRQKNAVIVLGGSPDTATNFSLIAEALDSKEKRMELSENGMRLIDGKGKERIRDIVLSESAG